MNSLDFLRYVFYVLEWTVVVMFLYVFLPVVLLPFSLTLFRRKTNKQASVVSQPAFTKFIILVPAHNEEKLLPALLESVKSQEYPKEFFQTLVIADNCHDLTAEIARKKDCICLERYTDLPSDKAQALRFGWQWLKNRTDLLQKSTLVLVDADCQLESHFLLEVHAHMNRPRAGKVLQTFRYVRNAQSSAIATLDASTEALRQWVLLGSRELLGMQSLICGSGVVFSHEVFQSLMADSSTTSVEDKMWQKYFLDQGIKVDWCPGARLSYDVVETYEEFQKQRKRWIGGQLQLGKRISLKVIMEGLENGSASQLDYGLSLIQLPRSSMVVICLLFSGLAFVFPGFSILSWWGWLSISLSFVFYMAIGLALIGASPKAYLSIFMAPKVLYGLFISTLSNIFKRNPSRWEATR